MTSSDPIAAIERESEAAVELKACPFCGGPASLRTFVTESLWSHDQVTYTAVGCGECEIEFSSEPGYEIESPEAWNRRAALSALVEEKPVTKAWSQSDAERENTAFHGWWKERGYDDYPIYTLTCQNACHAAWQAAAQRSALVDVPAVESEPVAWLVKAYGNEGMLLDTRLEFVKPIIRSTAKTEFIPLYASPVRSAIAPAPTEETWQPIETAPKPADWLKHSSYERFLVGHWFQPVDEDGEPHGKGSWAWVQVVSLTSSGWHVWSSFKGWHGTATIPVHDNATHWRPLPASPSLGHAEDGMPHGSTSTSKGSPDE